MIVAVEDADDSNCFFDFSLIDHMGQLPSLDSDFSWSSDPFNGSSDLGTGLLDSSCSKEFGSRKRVNPASCSSTYSKADREKKRRNKMNEKFQELSELIDPGRPPKTDKMVILGDAIRRVILLREEAQKLKTSTQDLQAKINELKAEKNELRDEKQKLKAEKERLEQQVKAFSRAPPTFFPYSQVPTVDGKFVPVMGYHGVPMWPFASAPAVDTSQDHILRSPLA